MQDIGTEYFGRFFDSKEKQGCYRSFGYNRYNVLSNIVMDFLFNLRQKVRCARTPARSPQLLS